MRRFTLLVLGTLLVLMPASAKAERMRYTQNVWNDMVVTNTIEELWDDFMELSSSLSGAPEKGRAIEANGFDRMAPPSAYERSYKNSGNPGIYAGSSRDISYTPLPAPNTQEIANPPVITLHSAPVAIR